MADAAGAPATSPDAAATRCGIDSVEVSRIERLLAETPAADLAEQNLALLEAGPARQ